MNIFDHYLSEIKNVVLNYKTVLKLDDLKKLQNINLEVPPEQFNFDLSCNISLVLAKSNKLNPKDLALQLQNLFKTEIKKFDKIEIAGPGFLNIKLSKSAMVDNIISILKNKIKFGSMNSNETFNIEFVSANPTGPMHVGHCRGAIYGDVLANLLKFNGNKVTKEYYINDYGNQIKNFVESVYLRIREVKFNEKFILRENLYPGLYIKDIALKILKKNKTTNFDNFEKFYKLLKEKSLQESMDLIKDDLSQLGIYHDNFFSETDLVNNDLVNKAVNKLKEKKYVEEGYLKPPKGENIENWKKKKKINF
jgi:arginyl-tRNA synthetase